jgi:predicted phage tail protein
MIKVFVYGGLGSLVGREWKLDISSPREAFSAIEANTGKLYKYLADKESEGVKYAIFVDKYPLESKEELGVDLSEKEEIHILPNIEGADSWDLESEGDYYRSGAQVFGVGAILKYMSASDWGLWDWQPLGFGVGDWLRSGFDLLGDVGMEFGLALALQGAIKSLTDESEPPDVADKPSMDSTNSFIFSNPTNNVIQGAVVPVGYGRLRIGSNVISSAVLNCRLNNLNDIEVDNAERDLVNDQDIAQHVDMVQGRAPQA